MAEVGSRVVGFILSYQGRGVHLAPEQHGQGIGHRLIEAFIHRCHSQGIKARTIIQEGDTQPRDFLSQFSFHKEKLEESIQD
ncbi:MAG: GNAT family N-acetyltransferase [Dehalococcoidia bacterium]|jgi:GNAT superfamily N-acetyltransferase|nr:GNAT family N-acetyltransferase [Dehalococcoidia bacterium]